jgi:hypothetical protein
MRVAAVILAVGLLAAGAAAASKPKRVTITGELFPTTPGGYSYTGTWTLKGGLVDKGTLTAAPTLISTAAITAVDKLAGAHGKLVLKLWGPPDDLAHWHWSLTSGTGTYKKLKGGGTAFVDQSNPDHVHEVLRGTLASR